MVPPPPLMNLPLGSTAGPMPSNVRFRPSGPPQGQHPHIQPGGGPMGGPMQKRGPPVPSSSSHGGQPNALKAQQEKQRQELLRHAQNFLNPDTQVAVGKDETALTAVMGGKNGTPDDAKSSQEKEKAPIEKKQTTSK